MATSTSFSLDTSFILGLLTGTGPPLLEVTTTTGMKLLMKGIPLGIKQSPERDLSPASYY